MVKKLMRTLVVMCVLGLVSSWFFFWSLMGIVRDSILSEATIEVTEIAAPIYRIDAFRNGKPVGGALVASVGIDGILLVDATASPVVARKVSQALVERWSKPITTVVLTHPHPDHVTGAAVFASAGAEIVGHARTAHWMSERLRANRWLPSTPPFPSDARPTRLIDRDTTLEFNGEEIRLLAMQGGHTDGDLAVVFSRSGVVHVGDLFHGPGSHSSASWVNGGSIKGLSRGVARLVDTLPPDARIIGGHSPPGSFFGHSDLVDYSALLDRAIAAVEAGLEGEVEADVLARELEASAGHDFSERPGLIMHGPLDGWIGNIETSLRQTR